MDGMRVAPANPPTRCADRTHRRNLGGTVVGLPRLCAESKQPIWAHLAVGATRRWPRPAPAKSIDDGASTYLVRWLCWYRRTIRLCVRGIAHRPPRTAMADVVAPLLRGRLGAIDDRHCAGKLVGLPRSWLGRLVVLGPGRKYQLDAMADRRCTHSLTCPGPHAEPICPFDLTSLSWPVLSRRFGNSPRPLWRIAQRSRLRRCATGNAHSADQYSADQLRCRRAVLLR